MSKNQNILCINCNAVIHAEPCTVEVEPIVDPRPAPFRVADAEKATLAVLRHNERDQRAQQQSPADGAATAKGGQAQGHQSGRRSPQPKVSKQTASDTSAPARPPNAATTSFSQNTCGGGAAQRASSGNHGRWSFVNLRRVV